MTEGNPKPPTVRLPLLQILWNSFALPCAHRVPLFRAIGIPLLAIIACFLVINSLAPGPHNAAHWGLYVLYGLAVSWLAIVVHQLVLLDSPVSAALADKSAVLKLAKFFAALAGFFILRMGMILLLVSGLMNALLPHYIPTGAPRAELPISMETMVLIASIFTAWVVARFSFVFPAIAIGRSADLMDAWRCSRGNGWRLAVVVGVLPWALGELTDFLYRDGATALEYGLLVVVSALCIVVQVVALSLSYSALTMLAPPPTPPPA